ncbi:hypothetical protein NC651_013375 [Populus alba x Populus x berolinensis]|nr:hypothetical protein NC651_013375 [Populus alba x Populus x berolinensis]
MGFTRTVDGWVLQIIAKMNDLMTRSFLSYVELKKQAQKDLKAELDIESNQTSLSSSMKSTESRPNGRYCQSLV